MGPSEGHHGSQAQGDKCWYYASDERASDIAHPYGKHSRVTFGGCLHARGTAPPGMADEDPDLIK
jgi:hypothetical protein